MRIETKRTLARAARSLAAITLVLCLMLSVISTAFAGVNAGSKPSSLDSSSTKVYIKLSRAVQFFTGTTYGTGKTVTPSAGSVCQLYTDDWYTASDGLKYYSVYYNSERYNVLRSDVVNDVMTATELDNYIRNTLWMQGSYATLRESMELKGDIRVHAVQLALNKLGYYNGNLDGSYGEQTADAVKKFQRAQGLGADGSAGPLTQPVLFSMASGRTVTGSGSSSTTTGSSSSTGTLRTNVSVNLRKNGNISSPRLAVVPKSVNLSYTSTYTSGGVTWYQVRYNGISGWLMGTFVTASGSTSSGSSSGSASSNAVAIGTVKITKGGTRVRDAADGNKTGYVLAKGTIVSLLAQPVSAGGYTWYNIRTGTGLVGFVRGDCATATVGGSTGGSGSGSSGDGSSSDLVVSTDKTFIELPSTTTLFLTETKPSSGGVKVSSGTVLMMYTPVTYTKDGEEYASVYYNNKKYNVEYDDVKNGIMTSSELSEYCEDLLKGNLGSSLKRNLGHTGDVRVYTLQSALKTLGYYNGTLDGNYGSGTETAVRNFQRATKISVDGACGSVTWQTLRTKLYGAGSSGSGGTSGGDSITVTDFGTVTSVQKVSWNYDDNSGAIFPKGTYATVMDVETGKCFRIYRWSGGNHADCVPASSADTKIMCDIVGFPYNSNHPSSSQLKKIKADGDKSVVTYTWPDYKNAFGGAKNIGSAWDRRAALLNVNGKVYPISIYGFPHGFNGTDSFSKSKFPNGQYFYAANNFYGMMCLHFPGSKTHGGADVDSKHQEKINEAYNYAKKMWPTLTK